MRGAAGSVGGWGGIQEEPPEDARCCHSCLGFGGLEVVDVGVFGFSRFRYV